MNKIEIQAHDGGTFDAYIALPKVTPAPVIIMIQEIFGVNQEMRDKCNHMAELGYIAIAPDLFWRIEPGINLIDSVPTELERAFELFGIFDQDLGIKDLESTLIHAKNLSDCSGKIGCIGYCLGGNLSYRMACETDIDASISYYGVGIENLLDQAKNINAPTLLHLAGNDEYVPAEAQTKIKNKMLDHEYVTVHAYPDMDHAFARGNGMHYNEKIATLANSRSEQFLKEALV